MEKVFFIVTSKEEGEAIYTGRITKMERAMTEDDVMTIVGQIATNRKDPRQMERIFSVDEFGNVDFFAVDYTKGKFQLVHMFRDGVND